MLVCAQALVAPPARRCRPTARRADRVEEVQEVTSDDPLVQRIAAGGDPKAAARQFAGDIGRNRTVRRNDEADQLVFRTHLSRRDAFPHRAVSRTLRIGFGVMTGIMTAGSDRRVFQLYMSVASQHVVL